MIKDKEEDGPEEASDEHAIKDIRDDEEKPGNGADDPVENE